MLQLYITCVEPSNCLLHHPRIVVPQSYYIQERKQSVSFTPEIMPSLEIWAPKNLTWETSNQCHTTLKSLNCPIKGILMFTNIVPVVIFSKVTGNHHLFQQEPAKFCIWRHKSILILQPEDPLHHIHQRTRKFQSLNDFRTDMKSLFSVSVIPCNST